jgi:Ice-binding-like
MHKRKVLTISILVVLSLLLTGQSFAVSARPLAVVTEPGLGSTASFAVLGSTKVENTGATVITGDLGVSPGSAATGFPPGIVNGVVHLSDAIALQAQTDLVTTYNTLAGESPCVTVASPITTTLTLVPGIYCFSSSAVIFSSGGLVLNLQGNPNSLFVFQIGASLTTNSGFIVSFINGSAPTNVWWEVGGSVTLGTNTNFVGNIVALTNIALNTGADIDFGRALSRTGAVTLDTNTITVPPPGAFTKTSPVNGATGQPPDLILSWGASSTAAYYEFCINTTSCTALSPWYSTGTSTSVGLGGLTPGATYIWQVRAGNLSDITYADSGISWSFTTVNPYHIYLPLVIRN